MPEGAKASQLRTILRENINLGLLLKSRRRSAINTGHVPLHDNKPHSTFGRIMR